MSCSRTQCSDAWAQAINPSISSQAPYHWATPLLAWLCRHVNVKNAVYLPRSSRFSPCQLSGRSSNSASCDLENINMDPLPKILKKYTELEILFLNHCVLVFYAQGGTFLLIRTISLSMFFFQNWIFISWSGPTLFCIIFTSMGESSKLPKSWTLEIQILKLAG